MADQHSPANLSSAVEECSRVYRQIRDELGKAMVGQDAAVEHVLIGLVVGGHVIVEGSPSFGKSLVLRCLAEALELRFRRIQFTPDLTPAEITGEETVREHSETGRRRYLFQPGPLFANLIVAADVDQASPKLQTVLFDAMEDRHVTVGGQTHPLPVPFFVLVAQSSLEPEKGTPLSQSQLDRFLLSVTLGHLSDKEEWSMARHMSSGQVEPVLPVVRRDDLLRLRQTAAQVSISDAVLRYAWALVRATRPTCPEAPEFVDRLVARGSGPRGLVALVDCAKARAALGGRCEVTTTDVEQLALPVLRHRVFGNFAAESQSLTSSRLVEMVMESVQHYAPP